MAIELTMAAMKVAILRNSMSGQRAGMAAVGGLLGLGLAGATIALAPADPDLLAAAYAVWMLGWILGPVFAGGGDETLKPEFFAPLGLPPRRLAAGLLLSAFVGIASVVSLVAVVGLAVLGVRSGAGTSLVSVPAMVLQLTIFVLLSKVTVAVLGLVLRSRTGAIGAGVLNGLIVAFFGQGWVFAVAYGELGGLPPAAVTVVRALPSGWGVVAVESAGNGRWLQAAGMLAAMAVLVALLLVTWAALLARRAGDTRPSTRGRRPMRAGTPGGAVLAKEVRTWSRDLVRTHQLTFALSYGVFFAAMPLIMGWNEMLPWAGPIFVLMAGALSANLYGLDGTALWLGLQIPGVTDVRGRQWAWLLIVGPVALVLTAALTAAANGPPAVLAAIMFALLGGVGGLVPLLAVYALVPGIDPHRRRGNPLRFTEDDGAVTGQSYAMLALGAITALPAGIVAVRYGWPGVVVGLATGALCWWGFGALAERRLRDQGPELLQLMRTGRRDTSTSKLASYEELPRARRFLVSVVWTLCPIALFPQGIVAGIFKVTGVESKAWFLALFLPSWLQWPAIVMMVAAGVGLGFVGVRLLRKPPAEEAMAA